MRLPPGPSQLDHESGACCGACEFAERVASGAVKLPEPGELLEPEGRYRLTVNHRGQASTTALDADRVTIGRSPQNDVAISSAVVSRRTCEITKTDRGLLLRDVGSSCGTYVNGNRVDRALLRWGDKIYLGDAVLEVVGA